MIKKNKIIKRDGFYVDTETGECLDEPVFEEFCPSNRKERQLRTKKFK